ncbi:MAG: hypothetical protein HY647_11840 [Acidobacteria bacterium]|nr:hypothetical protein [Acidobacteriota bacterium]
MKRSKWIKAITNAHPLDAELFGTMGAVTAELCASVSNDFIGKRYEFLDNREFGEIGNVSVMNQIYWKEMLFRVHWAAALNLMRHQRWQTGCIEAFKSPSNFLSFAASLRGLVEASLDANYSLAWVPSTLARDHMMIRSALEGSLQKHFVCKELEDRLIHFVYGRKVGKNDKVLTPESHLALEPRDYRNAIGLSEGDREGFRELYDELCGACHPTAFSLSFLWGRQPGENADTIHITADEDSARIRSLCQKYACTIQFAMEMSVSVSAICLKVLNWFPLPEVKCSSVERWNFDDVLLWRKVQALLTNPILNHTGQRPPNSVNPV